MTLAELRAEVRSHLREDPDTSPYFADADIDEALNAGYMELSDATEWCEAVADLALLPRRPYYDLFTLLGRGFLSIKPVFDTPRHRWLLPTAVRALDDNDPRWERVVGTPQRIWLRGLRWLGLYPRVESVTSQDVERVYYTRLPDPMVLPDDEPGFPVAYHMGCVYFALADLFATDGETQLALTSWQDYLAAEEQLRLWVQARTRRPLLRIFGALSGPR